MKTPPPRELEILGPDDVHVFWLPTSAIAGELATACEALLNDEEKERRARFVFDKNRHEYLVTRTLVRTTLSRYAHVRPSAWRFVPNQYGRPEIAGPEGAPRLHFNLSNTVKLVALIVSRDREVGIDVENSTRSGETVGIADRFFSERETKDLRALAVEHQRHRFFEYWTLKEAYIKARGMGLSLPLEAFSFLLDPGAPVRIEIDPKLEDDASTWEFRQYAPDAEHLGAIAVRRRNGAEARVTVRRARITVGDEGVFAAEASASASGDSPAEG